MLEPTGYYVLIEMEELDKKETGYIEGSSLIVAAPKEKKFNEEMGEREQNSHRIGVIKAFGPLAYYGYQGIEGDTAEQRAEEWGVKIGDSVDFNRHEGVEITHSGDETYICVTDQMIRCKVG